MRGLRAWALGALLALGACSDDEKKAAAPQPQAEAPAPEEPAPGSAEEKPAEKKNAAPEAKEAGGEPPRERLPVPPSTPGFQVHDEEEGEGEDDAPVATDGELLPGPDDLPIMKVKLVRGAPNATALGEGGVMLDRIDATFSPTATVGEVNQALEGVGARVCKMQGAGIPFIVVLCIPLQKDVAGVQKLADELGRSRAIVNARTVRGFKDNIVPP